MRSRPLTRSGGSGSSCWPSPGGTVSSSEENSTVARGCIFCSCGPKHVTASGAANRITIPDPSTARSPTIPHSLVRFLLVNRRITWLPFPHLPWEPSQSHLASHLLPGTRGFGTMPSLAHLPWAPEPPLLPHVDEPQLAIEGHQEVLLPEGPRLVVPGRELRHWLPHLPAASRKSHDASHMSQRHKSHSTSHKLQDLEPTRHT